MNRQIPICFLLIIFLFIISCEKETISPNTNIPEQATNKNVPPNTTTSSLAGFGNRPGTPSGSPFYLPTYIKITTPMTSRVIDYNTYKHYGVGYLSLFFTIMNFSDFNRSVTFPAGLTLLPNTDSAQSIMTLYPVKLDLPANTSEKIALHCFCINHDRVFSYAKNFTFHTISNNDQVTTLISAVKVKTEIELVNKEWFLQSFVWSISDGGGLRQTSLDSIANW